MANLFDIKRPDEPLPGNGGGISAEIILLKEDDVYTFPNRADDLVTIAGDIVTKTSGLAKSLYLTKETISPKMKKVPGDNSDSGAWECSVEGTHPGLSDLILKFKALFGFSFRGYVFFRDIVKNKIYVIGEPGNPVIIGDVDMAWSSKSKGTKFLFKAEQSNVIGIYTGIYPFQSGSHQ